jgi:hypothetical protein
MAQSGGRVVSVCDNRIAAGEMLVARRPSLDGVPGMHLGTYADWAAIAHFGERPPHDGMYRRVDTDGALPARRDLIDAANVGTVVTCGTSNVAGLQLAGTDGIVNVYRNTAAWPRVVWTCAAEALSPEDAMTRLLQTPLARSSQPGTPGISGTGTALLIGTRPCAEQALVHVQNQDRSDGRLTVRFEAPVEGWLLVSDAFYPERRAYVDGQRVSALAANIAFTAIHVPAGQHLIELRYVPVSFYVGAGISAVTMTGWAAAVHRIRKRSA